MARVEERAAELSAMHGVAAGGAAPAQIETLGGRGLHGEPGRGLCPYVCPVDHSALTLVPQPGGQGAATHYISTAGRSCLLRAGIPEFTYPEVLGESDAAALQSYEPQAAVYDAKVSMVFATFGADEAAVRAAQIDRLALTPPSRVLETGAGTGLQTVLIADRLGPDGCFCFQDLSASMLAIACRRLPSRAAGPRRDAEHSFINPPEAGDWDAEMQCYPALISFESETYMFYSGDGYGAPGSGCAKRLPARWQKPQGSGKVT